MVVFRRSDYWEEYSDEDLEHLKRSHEALINNCYQEIRRINKELDNRHEWDASESSHQVLVEGACYEDNQTY